MKLGSDSQDKQQLSVICQHQTSNMGSEKGDHTHSAEWNKYRVDRNSAQKLCGPASMTTTTWPVCHGSKSELRFQRCERQWVSHQYDTITCIHCFALSLLISEFKGTIRKLNTYNMRNVVQQTNEKNNASLCFQWLTMQMSLKHSHASMFLQKSEQTLRWETNFLTSTL